MLKKLFKTKKENYQLQYLKDKNIKMNMNFAHLTKILF